MFTSPSYSLAIVSINITALVLRLIEEHSMGALLHLVAARRGYSMDVVHSLHGGGVVYNVGKRPANVNSDHPAVLS